MSVSDSQTRTYSTNLRRELRHWFKFDNLEKKVGIALLLGFPGNRSGFIDAFEAWMNRHESNSYLDFRTDLFFGIYDMGGYDRFYEKFTGNLRTVDVKNAEQGAESRFRIVAEEYSRLLEYWDSGRHAELTPLTYFVDWSIRKDEPARWILTAERMGLIGRELSKEDTAFSRSRGDLTVDQFRSADISTGTASQKKDQISKYATTRQMAVAFPKPPHINQDWDKYLSDSKRVKWLVDARVEGTGRPGIPCLWKPHAFAASMVAKGAQYLTLHRADKIIREHFKDWIDDWEAEMTRLENYLPVAEPRLTYRVLR